MHPSEHIVGIDFTYSHHLDEVAKSLSLENRIHIYNNVEIFFDITLWSF
jgi:predicted ABC-type ATPase